MTSSSSPFVLAANHLVAWPPMYNRFGQWLMARGQDIFPTECKFSFFLMSDKMLCIEIIRSILLLSCCCGVFSLCNIDWSPTQKLSYMELLIISLILANSMSDFRIHSLCIYLMPSHVLYYHVFILCGGCF